MYKYYEIKVTIRHSHPVTWRRLRVPAGITFNDLAAIIEIAFEWCGYHLYEFEIGASVHGRGFIIGMPDDDGFVYSVNEKILDSGKERIDKYFKEYKRIKFTYDFGDDWIHDIVIEKEINEKLEKPVCIKAKCGAYPEDCGGTYGYEDEFPNDDGRNELDIEFINEELEEYEDIAELIYDREMY